MRGLGTIHDITQRKQAEHALQQSEQRYRSLFNALSEGVVVRDSSGQISAANPAACQILGASLAHMRSSAPGSDEILFFSDSGEPLPPNELPSMQTLATGKACRDRVLGVERFDGSRVWLSVNTEPLLSDDEQKPYAVVISFQDITRRRKAEHELRLLATTDVLTGLLNRRACTRAIEQELARCKRMPEHQSTLMLLDLDFFKSINDRYGHAAGDAALVHVAKLMELNRRELDVASRWGGEEFVMLLPGTDLEGARILAERLRSELEQQPIEYSGQTIELTVSVGVALLQAQDDQLDAVLVRADGALYRAKSAGRNVVVTQQDYN